MLVKICGITNLEDARAAIDAGASALGFNFYPASPRYITPEQTADLIDRLPGPVCKVGVFVDEPKQRVAELARMLRLDVAQLHGHESAADYPEGIRIWKAFRIGLIPPSDCPAEALLLDGPSSGTTFDWSVATGFTRKIVLAGGLDADNVRQAIEQVRPWGVDACSRIERAPGRKDHVKMAEFIKAALC